MERHAKEVGSRKNSFMPGVPGSNTGNLGNPKLFQFPEVLCIPIGQETLSFHLGKFFDFCIQATGLYFCPWIPT
jgi:hypothetical protein